MDSDAKPSESVDEMDAASENSAIPEAADDAITEAEKKVESPEKVDSEVNQNADSSTPSPEEDSQPSKTADPSVTDQTETAESKNEEPSQTDPKDNAPVTDEDTNIPEVPVPEVAEEERNVPDAEKEPEAVEKPAENVPVSEPDDSRDADETSKSTSVPDEAKSDENAEEAAKEAEEVLEKTPVESPANSEKSSGFTHVNVDNPEVASEDSEPMEMPAKNALAEEEMEVDEANKSKAKGEMEAEEANKAPDSEAGKQDETSRDSAILAEASTSVRSETAEKSRELENTEFVQITQDKQDDSQIEGTSMDAEDPFGGDNLCPETPEQIETEAIERRASLEQLGERADNLQDVVNAKGSGADAEKEPEEAVEKSSKADGEKADKNPEKDKSAPEVLPGQDDELCIIPDSMKVVIPKRSEDKPGEKDAAAESEPASENGEVVTIAESPETLAEKSKDDSGEKSAEKDAVVEKEPSPKQMLRVATDVIDVDEESKGSDEIEEIQSTEICKMCKIKKPCKFKVKSGKDTFGICSKACRTSFQNRNNKAMDIPSDGVNSKKEKRCASCLLIVESKDERNLSWETMEFCNEECLGKFQTKYGSYCRNCNGAVQAVSLGKYCVRFGYDVRQFCCSTCLEEFKKGLKVCSYCQKDISAGTEGFLAPVGDKGQFKDFCTQECMEKYSRMSSSEPYVGDKKACGVCQQEKIVHCEVQIDRASPVPICSDPCFAAFKFVNKVDPEQCSTCKKYFETPSKKGFVVFYEKEAHSFCSKTCLNVFIITNRKIVPCNWCKVKKYNFDMIKKELKIGQVIMMCSLNCLTLCQVSINAVSAKRIKCDHCRDFSQAQYHLTMSDATIRNFCSYNCVMNFQGQYTKSPITIPSSDDPVPTGPAKRSIQQPQRVISQASGLKAADLQNKKTMPVISSVTSLAMSNGQTMENSTSQSQKTVGVQQLPVSNQPQIIYKQQVITRPPSPAKMLNRMTQCKPVMHTKGVTVRPRQVSKSTQTDKEVGNVIPIPVPIYVPFPIHMFSFPLPIPVPFAIPVPVPIFIPTTRNSAKGIFKDIKKIQEKMPSDPFEAELLMMAEMVATEKKTESDSDSAEETRDEVVDEGNAHSDSFSPEAVDSSNTFGDDMLQMALKMATGEIEEPAVDLEAALTPSTIPSHQAANSELQVVERVTRGRKRASQFKPRASKRVKKVPGETPLMPPPDAQSPSQQRFVQPLEKPDANMALKYTFGVNAWRQWVVAKNTELEKQSTPSRKLKLFKSDLLQLTADELNYSLCLFVKEVRKPNGTEYAPDTIYYLCLGIQQYLLENNRIDNIFTDSYYEKFTDCLNDVAKKFAVIFNDSQYIVTRVEEEHLWECKQLGAHSPHVLLNTLMFFNTKHFNLVTVQEHMQLSFSHIMKHWKRNPAAQPSAAAGKLPGSRNVLLRFYPPQSALDANSKKKKVYEQQENEDNPLRCPVKLYEFYLSKCPESVKTRNDIFYLLPERSCVPDSPVWYSTSALPKDQLVKMLHRVKMVKEINVALLLS